MELCGATGEVKFHQPPLWWSWSLFDPFKLKSVVVIQTECDTWINCNDCKMDKFFFKLDKKPHLCFSSLMLPCLIRLLLCTWITSDKHYDSLLMESSLSSWGKTTVRCITSSVNRICSILLHHSGLCKWRFVEKCAHLQPWNCNAVLPALAVYMSCVQPSCFKTFRDQRQVFTEMPYMHCIFQYH